LIELINPDSNSYLYFYEEILCSTVENVDARFYVSTFGFKLFLKNWKASKRKVCVYGQDKMTLHFYYLCKNLTNYNKLFPIVPDFIKV
jgi:hypothetical protein